MSKAFDCIFYQPRITFTYKMWFPDELAEAPSYSLGKCAKKVFACKQ